MTYWQGYNESLNTFTQVIVEHNKNNKFNADEASVYNHVRDILGITLSILSNNKNG